MGQGTILAASLPVQTQVRLPADRYTFLLHEGLIKTNIAALAARSAFGEGDEPVIQIGRRSRIAGCYTRDDFFSVCEWARSNGPYADNTAEEIQSATRLAIS